MTDVLERPIVAEPETASRTWTREQQPPRESGSEPRRNTSTLRTVDVIRALGSAAAALAFTSWIYFFALPLQGELGFVLIAYGFFLLIFGLLTAFDENGPTVGERFVALLVQSVGVVILLGLFSVVI